VQGRGGGVVGRLGTRYVLSSLKVPGAGVMKEKKYTRPRKVQGFWKTLTKRIFGGAWLRVRDHKKSGRRVRGIGPGYDGSQFLLGAARKEKGKTKDSKSAELL